MGTTDISILRQFRTVLNKKDLTDEILNRLLDRWGFSNIDLDEENVKINQKTSTLSRSKREAIPEFIALRNMLNEKKNEEALAMSSNSISTDQLSI